MTLYKLLNENKDITLITFLFKGYSKTEKESAVKIGKQAKCQHIFIDINFINSINHKYIEYSNFTHDEDIKFLPGRNIIFLNIASIIAYEIKIKTIYTGIIELEGQSYPDCTDSFLKSMANTISIGLGSLFYINNPLLKMDITEQKALGEALKINTILKKETHSCFYNIKGGCLKCKKCLDRKLYFLKNE